MQKKIVYINVMSWKNTYKEIFPQSFLYNLDPTNSNIIQNCKNGINEYIICELNSKVVGFGRYGLNKKIMIINMVKYMLYILMKIIKIKE